MKHPAIAFILTALFALAIGGKDAPTDEVHDVTLVQYNAPFNKHNEHMTMYTVKGAEIMRICIDRHPEIKVAHRIKSVPTIILYKQGFEVKRWEAGLAMSLDVSKEEIQRAVNTAIYTPMD